MISAAHQVHPPSPQLVQTIEAVSVLLEGLFYGGFVVLFLTNCYLRLSRRDKLRRGFRRLWCNAIVLPTLAIFATCTAHWVIDVILFFSTFLSSPGANGVIFNQHAMHLKDGNGCLTLATVLVMDGVIIHRLWIIWNRKILVVALPIILWLGVLVDGVATLYLIIHGRMLAVPASWVTANWALSSATNMYCLIAWRIWRTCHVAEDTKTKPFMSVLVVLVESAAIWTAWSTFAAVAVQTGSPLQPIASNLMMPMAGIVNTLIHIRVGFLSRTRDGTTNPLPAMTDYASMVGEGPNRDMGNLVVYGSSKSSSFAYVEVLVNKESGLKLFSRHDIEALQMIGFTIRILTVQYL
ncbi:hypothetical protein GGX14DRAFT_592987 [Mycena pura]|uniref:Uncharacterized protein n=1 Tax=Mycena pura TaxID=153505 RepID=A0AAD6XYX7_9AGAR|nr:hypothetical protein GGX14DRAFT_592987 [Mycena pura]